MKLTPWMLTVSAFLIMALLAVGFIFKKLTARVEVAAPTPESRRLPMATADIEPGTEITRNHLGIGPWSATESLPPDTFTTSEGIIGRIAREKISAAKPLRGTQFYGPGERPDLKIADGKRAVTVNVGDETSMVSGLIRPEQFVDVNLTIERPATAGIGGRRLGEDIMTLTLFDGVRVVAMNRSFTQTSVDRGHNVTLELDPDQARILMLAMGKGKIGLAYNPDGPGTGGVSLKSDEQRVTLQELLGIVEPVEKRPFLTEHYHGTEHGTTYFDNGRRVDSSTRINAIDNVPAPDVVPRSGDDNSVGNDREQKNKTASYPRSSSAAGSTKQIGTATILTP